MRVVAAVKNSDDPRDPRDALREAIRATAEARAELDRHQQAAGRARDLMRKSAAALEAAAAAITEANEEDASALANAIVSGKSSSSAARAKLRQQDYVRRAERALEIVRELGLEDRL